VEPPGTEHLKYDDVARRKREDKSGSAKFLESFSEFQRL
jgi:hypothetical protein